MKGKIVNYRRGRHTFNPYQMIIVFEGIESREEAEKLIGKTVVWKTPGGKEIRGKITAPHGNKGAVRVRFERGMPGQAIGDEVLLLD